MNFDSKAKCIVILSNKSSGSSACQNLLAKFSQVNCVSKTRHEQNETLYWTKAASVLGLPQRDMLDSEVPIPRDRARADLIRLLSDNLDSYIPPDNDTELIFDGWKRLCQKYSPIFLEKSPHHLYQWSALKLIAECIEKLPEVDFCIVGLVRNPMDTLYSTWKRWKTIPEQCQYEWLIAYKNLLKFKTLVGDKLKIVRYEDMVSDLAIMKEVFEFIGIRGYEAENDYLHRNSISKWKIDKLYGFRLSDEVVALAKEYGYIKDEMSNRSYLLWPIYRNVSCGIYKAIGPVLRTLSKAKKKLLNAFSCMGKLSI